MTKRTQTLLLSSLLLTLPLSVSAQPGARNPAVLPCGKQGEAELICGARAPEDFEPTPDGKFLIVGKMAKGDDNGFDLLDLATQKFSRLEMGDAPKAGWGDKSCTTPIGTQVMPHGLSLVKRSDGAWELFAVNHTGREAMEMYELVQAGASWKILWHGCVMAQSPYNDVAGLPDGSFIATRPTAIQKEGQDLFKGEPSGNIAVWRAGTGEQVLPGTEIGYPNGVALSKDGRYAYVSGWTSHDMHKYDLMTKKEVVRTALTFMPDNLTWTPGGKLLAAGVKGVGGDCTGAGASSCLQAFGIAEIDPDTMKARMLYDITGKAWINGVSTAIEAGNFLYVGAFQGDRVVKLPRK